VAYALGSSVVYSDGRATADGERPSFTVLASYLRAAGAMAWPMKANSRRRCIAVWAKREDQDEARRWR